MERPPTYLPAVRPSRLVLCCRPLTAIFSGRPVSDVADILTHRHHTIPQSIVTRPHTAVTGGQQDQHASSLLQHSLVNNKPCSDLVLSHGTHRPTTTSPTTSCAQTLPTLPRHWSLITAVNINRQPRTVGL